VYQTRILRPVGGDTALPFDAQGGAKQPEGGGSGFRKKIETVGSWSISGQYKIGAIKGVRRRGLRGEI